MKIIPKISIVTPSFNQGQFIEETITSVLDQQYPNLEYIIIDGGSTDNSVEIIKKHEKHLTYWVSENDNGQAHAINKGLKYCTGEIFNWLNSDDYLAKNALVNIAKGFASGTDMVAGDVEIFNKNGVVDNISHSNLSSKGLLNWEPEVKFVQPGVWLKKDLISACGGIDENFHFAFDWDLYIRYLSKYPSVQYIDNLIIYFRYHEQSKTVSSQNNFQSEELKIIRKLADYSSDRKLQKIAHKTIISRDLRKNLKGIVNTPQKNKIQKSFEIVKQINKDTLPQWRAIGGALKNTFTGKNI